MLTLLQNVAVLGILGLAMAIVVIGRGIDISLIAALAVPPGLVLQMVQDGHSLPASMPLQLRCWRSPSASSMAGSSPMPKCRRCSRHWRPDLFLAGLGQAALFKLDVVQWSPGMEGFEHLGQGTILGVPTPIVMFAIVVHRGGLLPAPDPHRGAYIYAIGDNPYAARVTGIPTRPIIVLQYVLAALIGCFAGLVLAASVN